MFLPPMVNYFLPNGRYTSVMSLGKRIEGARLARDYKESAAFARDCGISKQYLYNLEHDLVKKPDPAQLLKIANQLRVTLDWLWTGEGLPDKCANELSEDVKAIIDKLSPSALQLAIDYDELDQDAQLDVAKAMAIALGESKSRKIKKLESIVKSSTKKN